MHPAKGHRTHRSPSSLISDTGRAQAEDHRRRAWWDRPRRWHCL